MSGIGRGAMGQVYLAEDTKLPRLVALKLLPPDVARDPRRVQRFLRRALEIDPLYVAAEVKGSIRRSPVLHGTRRRVGGAPQTQFLPGQAGLPVLHRKRCRVGGSVYSVTLW